MRLLSRLLSCQSGNVGMMFAIGIVPMLLAVGAGVDYLRANQAQTVLQAAADAAALAGGASSKTTEAEIKQVAQDYIDANNAADAVKVIDVADMAFDAGTGAFKVNLKGKIDTSFMALAGISEINIGAVSEVRRGSSGPLEMVLALDITYSMSENDKIGTLKTAATNLVKAVMKGDNVKVGIAPFASYFKVGMKYKDEPWVAVPADQVSDYESCNWDYPNATGCSTTTSTCYSDGVPYSCTNTSCTDWGDPVKTGCHMVHDVNGWDGCIGARPPAHHNSIGDVGVPYPGVIWDCGPELVDLTNNKGDMISAISNLWVSGETNIPSGLIWAWNMLTSDAPLTSASTAAEITAKGGKKAMVLMTDGTNTASPYDDGNYGAHADTSYGDGTYTDNLTATLCENMKAEGIVVYTVLFDVTDADTETLLRNCATSPDKSFVADDAAELITAFGKIGTSLTQLRISK